MDAWPIVTSLLTGPAPTRTRTERLIPASAMSRRSRDCGKDPPDLSTHQISRSIKPTEETKIKFLVYCTIFSFSFIGVSHH
jgi:hypothetical protein